MLPVDKKYRHRFFRSTIGDAHLEMVQQGSPAKIMETALLTGMGALGATYGFIATLRQDNGLVDVVSRGLKNGEQAFIKDNLLNLHPHYFSSDEISNTEFYVDIKTVPAEPGQYQLFGDTPFHVVVDWRFEKLRQGLMGFGRTLNGRSLVDDEKEFLFSLTDRMMMALQNLATRSFVHTLENELDQARQRTAETTASSLAVKKDLEETLFRQSGFDDIFHELSGLRSSAQVVDAFLLVLLGIFSAENGHIVYWDDTNPTVQVASRGPHHEALDVTDAETVKQKVQHLFELQRMDSPSAMDAAVLPAERLKLLAPQIPGSHIALLFQLDNRTRGILSLGKRIVAALYGPREQEQLVAFTRNFLAFLKNSRSFETIQRLHDQQEQKNIELNETIEALSSCRTTIDGMEKAGERIKTAIAKATTRTKQISIADITMILIAGIALGLAYNFASPSGISIMPAVWQQPPSTYIHAGDADNMVRHRDAIFVDARPTEFYKQKHIDGAFNLPPGLFDFVYMMQLSNLESEKPLVVYGRTFSRHYDETIAFKLTERGHREVYVLRGGLAAWQGKGLPVNP